MNQSVLFIFKKPSSLIAVFLVTKPATRLIAIALTIGLL